MKNKNVWKMKIKVYYLFLLLTLASCAKRNLAYFSDLDQSDYAEKINYTTEPKIHADDLLSISVTSLNPEANALFNRGEMPNSSTAGSVTNFSITGGNSSNIYREGYLVDKDGFIDFPVLGRICIGGLTKVEAKEKLINELQEYLKEPIVNIRYLNYKVTVIGEVNRPSTFTIPSEKINILEALGMAGDMTAYGKRENVLIIREEAGVRKMTRLNLNNTELVNSPYFYLQQNDVVYVEPHKTRRAQASNDSRYIAIATSVVSLLIAVIYRF